MIEIKNIIKKRDKDVLLEGISLAFGEKGVFGILVPDVTAKRALSGIMRGIDNCFEGEVTVKGDVYLPDDGERKRMELRRRIGYVPEEVLFYNGMTVYELLLFAGEAKKTSAALLERQIKEAMELTGISEIKNILFSNASRTERKRIALAMALLGNPDVIIIDEPFVSEKDEGFEFLMDIISMLGKIKQVIVITSVARIAEMLCGSVALICDGRLVVQDSLEGINERLNSTRTLLLRLVSKNGYGADETQAILSSMDGVSDVVVKSTSSSGEMNIKLECDPHISGEKKIEDMLSENGYIVLSLDSVRLSLSDVCAVLGKKGGN